MHWTRGRRGFRIITRGKSRGVGQADSYSLISACLLILAFTVFLRGAPGEKHLSVYSVAANYSLPLVEREGQDYVGLLELLEPLGTVAPGWTARVGAFATTTWKGFSRQARTG